MAVVGTARPIQSQISVDEEFNRSYTSTYEVITNDVTDGPALVLTANGLPQFGSEYVWYNTTDSYAFCVGGSATIREVKATRMLWVVTIKHETPKSSKSGGKNTRQPSTGNPNPISERQDPRDEPWEISGSFAQFQRPAVKDMDGKPLQNTVEEPFIPAIEIDESRKTLVLRKNTGTINLSSWVNCSDKVNGTPMWGLLPRQVKLNQWNWTLRFFGAGIGYVENTFEFHISYEKDDQGNVVGWTHVILNEGFRKLKDPDSTDPEKRYQRITLKDQPVSKPVLLNQEGYLLFKGVEAPYYNKFKIYEEVDFLAIGIPNPLPGGVFQ